LEFNVIAQGKIRGHKQLRDGKKTLLARGERGKGGKGRGKKTVRKKKKPEGGGICLWKEKEKRTSFRLL